MPIVLPLGGDFPNLVEAFCLRLLQEVLFFEFIRFVYCNPLEMLDFSICLASMAQTTSYLFKKIGVGKPLAASNRTSTIKSGFIHLLYLALL